jgi:hypothetical protein
VDREANMDTVDDMLGVNDVKHFLLWDIIAEGNDPV